MSIMNSGLRLRRVGRLSRPDNNCMKEITINGHSGQGFNVRVNQQGTVDDLKEAIYQATSIPKRQQQITLKNDILQDSQPIPQDTSHVFLVRIDDDRANQAEVIPQDIRIDDDRANQAEVFPQDIHLEEIDRSPFAINRTAAMTSIALLLANYVSPPRVPLGIGYRLLSSSLHTVVTQDNISTQDIVLANIAVFAVVDVPVYLFLADFI